MKRLLITLSLLLSVICVNAQSPGMVVTWRTYGADSVRLPMNDQYLLIADTCATIYRSVHYNSRARKFWGHFTDVSKANPSVVVASGTYSQTGLKDGEFITRSVTGALLSKGHFKANKFDGAWEIYYPDGKPRLTFEAVNGVVKIFNAWDDKGNKIIDNGKGDFTADLRGIAWKGTLVNGKPDGKWKAVEVNGNKEQTILVTEVFADGQFKKGEMKMGKYTDESHISLVGEGLLPYFGAEKMQISTVSCEGIDAMKQRTTHAQYHQGVQPFTDEIGRAILNYLNTVDLSPYHTELLIEGVVTEKGAITDFVSKSVFNESITSGIIRQLHTLPLLQPATANGKPIKEKITIYFSFNAGRYSYGWRMSGI